MRARGTARALGVAPIVAACAVICGVPTAFAMTDAPSQHGAGAVVARTAAVATTAAVTTTTTVKPTATVTTPKPAVKPRRKSQNLVASRFAVRALALAAQAGHFMTLQGRLLPVGGGKVVELAGQSGGRWTTLARGRTRPSGRFALRYTVAHQGLTRLRVTYAGGPGTRATAASAGTVVGLEPTVASWYYDAGDTACGFHAYYGVANKTLPCGTRVTFEYGGRSVVATVDDRGPYVYGRSFDFNQNVSRALGMYGVATVLASVQ